MIQNNSPTRPGAEAEQQRGAAVCPLCCPVAGHSTSESPYWLSDSTTMPAHWRFTFNVLSASAFAPAAGRQEKLDAARLYAQVYGDRALARAILEAKALPVPHGHRWDSLWDRVLADLHQAVRP